MNSTAPSTSEGPGGSIQIHPATKVSPGPSRTLYHGGAPGFRPGEIIEPHPTRHVDDCQWCASGADDNHRPDRVFATPVRLYGKFYASKYVDGWLYLVEPIGEWELSDNDPIEAYHAAAVRVVSVSERCVRLTPAERRRLWRIWKEADDAAGRHTDYLTDLRTKRAMGVG